MKDLVDYVDTKLMEVYTPKKCVMNDVSTVALKGRAIFEVYNPMKPMKWDFQVYLMAEFNIDYVSAYLHC